MSSISSIGGGNGLFGILQSLSATTASQAATASVATTNTAATTGPDLAQLVQGGGHHHHHHGQGGQTQGANNQLFSQIQQAVTSALQSATQSGTNPNQAVETAISQVFQNNNSAAQSTSTSAAQTNTPASTTDAQGTTGTPSSTGNSALQAFFQTLQNAGIDPQQFHQDFLTAVQNAQSGTANPATAFQSFPPGSILDAVG